MILCYKYDFTKTSQSAFWMQKWLNQGFDTHLLSVILHCEPEFRAPIFLIYSHFVQRQKTRKQGLDPNMAILFS